jgi:hypothetical protein
MEIQFRHTYVRTAMGVGPIPMLTIQWKITFLMCVSILADNCPYMRTTAHIFSLSCHICFNHLGKETGNVDFVVLLS